MAKCVEDVGVGFIFAPRYHPAMKAVAPVRKSLKIKTAFNILGPMLNPSRAPHSIVGVYHENLVSLTIAFSLLILEIVAIIQICRRSLRLFGYGSRPFEL